jgi:hypothetical protein
MSGSFQKGMIVVRHRHYEMMKMSKASDDARVLIRQSAGKCLLAQRASLSV